MRGFYIYYSRGEILPLLGISKACSNVAVQKEIGDY